MNPAVMDPSDPANADKILISSENMRINMNQIDSLRSFMMIAGGIMAGSIQCVGIYGFLCFLILYVVITIALGLRIKFDFKTYTNMTLMEFALLDISKHVMSFVLFWTLSYALVYIY